MSANKPQVFISYAREDEAVARQLYEDLKAAGLNPWLDRESLLPGQKWKSVIPQAIRGSTKVIALMSTRSVQKRGYVQTELRQALVVVHELPDSSIFLIPARLDECAPPLSGMDELNWVDLFPDYQQGLQRILKAVQQEDAARQIEDIMKEAEVEEQQQPSSRAQLDLVKSYLQQQEQPSSRVVAHMKLHIAAINHFAPLVRKALQRWLEELASTYPEPPAFVAVPFDRDHFTAIRLQRPEFRHMLREHWPALSPSELNLLTNSLAYEGDVHLEVFPDTSIVWLDEGRELHDPEAITKYAERRLNIYKQYSQDETLPLAEQITRNLIQLRGNWLWPDEQDRKFANIVAEEIHSHSGMWAVVIVGADRASADIDGSMLRLLEEAGVDCHVTSIDDLLSLLDT